jgi:hypothetical protein
MRIGLDVHIANKVREALKGVTVVQAMDAESDAAWFARGVALGMTHVYSGDEDLRELCEGTPVIFIKARKAQSLRNQLRLIQQGSVK